MPATAAERLQAWLFGKLSLASITPGAAGSTRLDATPRRGTLIAMRDKPDRRRKVHLPWLEDYFRHRTAAIRSAAGIDAAAKFMGLRHGGNTEDADAI